MTVPDWAGRIYVGDCLDVLRDNIPDDSVSLIVTSPPYSNQRKGSYGGIDPADYPDWMAERAREFMRVLKPDGSFILNIREHREGGNNPYVYDTVLKLVREVEFCWIDECIWYKPNPMPGEFKYLLRNAYERLYHFAPTLTPKRHTDRLGRSPTKQTQRSMERQLASGNYLFNRHQTENQYRMRNMKDHADSWSKAGPLNVITLSPGGWARADHPATFPEYIPWFFIEYCTDVGDVVLDPFSGSGTTYRVAEQAGRVPVGVEILERYVPDGGPLPLMPNITTRKDERAGQQRLI